VHYLPILDGGGQLFGQDYIPVVKKLFGKVRSLCEFGSGPGFIGFSLLAHSLCDRLCLIDVNPLAIEACKRTIKANHLEKRVHAYISTGLQRIPKDEQWDLVVSNPPHFDGKMMGEKDDILFIDPHWQIHKKFYGSVHSHLKKNGSVLFVENAQGSEVSMFLDMIREGGLEFVKTFRYQTSLWETVAHNIGVWSNICKISKLFYFIKVFKRMNVRLSSLLKVTENPYYLFGVERLMDSVLLESSLKISRDIAECFTL